MHNASVDPEASSKVIEANSENRQNKNIEAFDFLRAIFSIIVVAIHADFFILGEILVSSTLTILLRANVGYIAVPIFCQISLFLFSLKSEKTGKKYLLKKRLPKLLSLYCFWVISLIVLEVFLKGDNSAINWKQLSLQELVQIIVSGGKSPFYFFFSLIFIILLTEPLIALFRRLENPRTRITISYSFLFISCALVFLFSFNPLIISSFNITKEITFFRVIYNLGEWHYNPLNFLPYIFTTAITVQEFKAGKLKKLTSAIKLKLYVLLALFLMFTVLEWSLLEKLVHYARLSIVFGSWLLIYLALLSTRKPPTTIKFLSACSLGIYGFHPFFTHILYPLNTNFLLTLDQIMPGLDTLVKFLVAIIGSIVLTLIFRRIKGLKNFV
ncbi:MAG TPA: acyltransferase family protein [Coleofasciculaceae cyanobacterium]